jgi:hypothetical protein
MRSYDLSNPGLARAESASARAPCPGSGLEEAYQERCRVWARFLQPHIRSEA